MKSANTGCIFISVLINLLAVGVGCSTAPKPVPNSHQGFLDNRNVNRKRSFYDRLAQSQSVPNRYGKRVKLVAPHINDPFDLKWPLTRVEVTSPYGKRGREFHEGIDLRAKKGTPVYAAQTGVVIYADSKIRGYGRMIVIRHDGKMATIYAHNSKLLVSRGNQVKQGQKIAYTGNTGHSSGPHLHFEIRRGVSPVNPLGMLRRPSLVASSR